MFRDYVARYIKHKYVIDIYFDFPKICRIYMNLFIGYVAVIQLLTFDIVFTDYNVSEGGI